MSERLGRLLPAAGTLDEDVRRPGQRPVLRGAGRPDQRPSPVQGDRGQLEQVLVNLYLNAWQAMSEKGDLHLRTQNVTIDKHFVKSFKVADGE